MQIKIDMPEQVGVRASEAIILIGSVPCQVPGNDWTLGESCMHVVNPPSEKVSSRMESEGYPAKGKGRKLMSTAR
jgi:hypothetical protein